MRKQSLWVAALCAAGFSLSVAHAAPAAGILPVLKASAGEGGAIQQVRYRHHHHARHHHHGGDCWWKDRELCRWFW
jgi:hypothetical protein